MIDVQLFKVIQFKIKAGTMLTGAQICFNIFTLGNSWQRNKYQLTHPRLVFICFKSSFSKVKDKKNGKAKPWVCQHVNEFPFPI